MPEIDVASIKPHASAKRITFMGMMNAPDGINAAVVTLPTLVQYAYGLLMVDQLTGAPDWAKDGVFDMQPKVSEADLVEM